MTGIILSGGKNFRMGENKAFLKVRGERIIERTVGIFRKIFKETIIVTNDPLAYLEFDVKIATDIFPGKGPLGGLYTGLFFSSFGFAFVTSCDMPFLNSEFILYMKKHEKNYDILVPSPADGIQPLHAVYSKRCLHPIKKLIEKDLLKIRGFYKHCKYIEIPDSIIRSFDEEGKMFLNLNCRDDLENIVCTS
jgi:molybdopterin-guanine dinucleotide biosynthesis protein A